MFFCVLRWYLGKRTIAINILDYELFEEGPYHEIARLKREYKNNILTDTTKRNTFAAYLKTDNLCIAQKI